jgi:diaminohydroxyphosphoribosylaminopyrimidine deaminase/5-amino-6-(5-phosphoribosylamino)uracil reductase
VGTKTVIDDNPKLDVRDWTGNPVRIVLDQNSRLQKKSQYLTIKKKLSFYKTTTNTDKENLTFTVIDFEKHSNSIDRCTV